MSQKTKIQLDLVGITHHVHLANRVAKAMTKSGASAAVVEDFKNRMTKSAYKLSTGEALGIILDFCEIE